MARPVDISVCIPVYRAHPAPNLATIAERLPAALDGLEGELVIALNGIGAADALVPVGARTVDLGANRGVAPGWNAAAGAATGRVLCFANDDLELGPASLATLVEALDAHPDAGVVGPVGTAWDIGAGTHREWVDTSALGRGEVAACEVVSGFCFATRRESFDAVGGFDEFYAPCSWEEVDFCTAVRHHGLRCYAVAGVDIAHEWGISRRALPWKRVHFDGRSETLRSIHRRNRSHFLQKWSGRPVATQPA